MDVIRWFIGQDAPKAVTAIGGQFAGIKDNREIPDTLQVLWEFDKTLVVFEQYNANAAPGERAELRDRTARHEGHDVRPQHELGRRAGEGQRPVRGLRSRARVRQSARPRRAAAR